ncbi:MAG TPA: hypothetical protein VNX25_10730 [Verrucomicrobiae bacterium]|nr:hypothetical protein [Verrucomicrobiae bacterium]
MIQLDLAAEEAEILLETLTREIGDISMEIADTDRLDFRTMLKKRRDVLNKTIESIRQARCGSTL